MKHLWLLLLLFTALSASTPDSLTYVKRNGKTYISYKVKKGDGLYALGRRFNVDPDKILEANPKSKKELNIGQTLLIPVEKKDDNSESAVKNNPAPKPKETAPIEKKQVEEKGTEPVYYTVKGNETLYRVAMNNHAAIEDIKKWNKLKSNALASGKKLIVGYKSQEKQVSAGTEKEKKASNSRKNTDEDYIDPKYVEEYKKSQKSDKEEGGEVNEVTEKGVAGWIDDGSVISNKSLALHKTAPPGTVIKITNVMNGRHQYVKVIGKLPKTSDDDNVSIKITKTLAEKLGVLDKYFRVEMHYALESNK